jgi:undecaprenyl-diphosphatase
MSFTQATILAIIEGLTEFLHVSSTGHMIIASSLMGISDLPITKIFTVNIQFGAILSVVALYWRRFAQGPAFYGGVLLLYVDRWVSHADEQHVSYGDALLIGFCHCIAMVPGVSRSAASIIGGLTQGVGSKTAAGFSFFLAVAAIRFFIGFLTRYGLRLFGYYRITLGVAPLALRVELGG